jgi:ATP-dependent helicase/nuclease subunit A
VHVSDDLPVRGVTVRVLTDEQEQAVARRSEPLLLAAGAGSGKTSVLVERFVRAVREDDVAPGRILAITFTERAAGELRERVRRRFMELGEREAARDTEAAFVSTFHGFCARLLRVHPLAAGLDPEFTILEESLAGRLRGQAWATALRGFLKDERSDAVDLVAAYGADRVRAMIGATYAELRSRGMRLPKLPVTVQTAEPDDEIDAAGLRACALLDELLERFGHEYEACKRRRGAVDFDDLELGARELLDEHESVRTAWAERFELLMVDEFQDTNPRQLAILRSLDRGNLFTVGDELQSIYGFRHADVNLFRARRDELVEHGGGLSLTRNFRGRRSLLDAVNVVFAERFGDGYTPLQAGRDEATVLEGEPIVELLLTHKRGWDEDEGLAERIAGELPPAPRWRQAEARLLAQRVAELIEGGTVAAGDVAVLLRAVGDLELYERALKDRGLSTLATVGGFWNGQQVGDLVAYLRALTNPLDELALYGTLASPLVGVSSDGLALLAAAAKASKRGVWETLRRVEESPPDDLSLVRLSATDRGLLRRFCARFQAERSAARRRTISQLLERALEQSGYAEHVMSLSWGERRLANVHKLLRVARWYEASEGRDLRGFLDHVAHQQDGMSGAEPDAPVADGESDAVRLMSIHAAKGLEFGVVCVADLGRAQNLAVPDLLVDGDRIGLRLARLDGSEATLTLDFDELCEERRRAQAEEEERILYVAMTRARERLLLSGAVDLEHWPELKLGAPAISWLGPALVAQLPAGVQTLESPVRDLPVSASDGTRLQVGCRLNAPETVGVVLRLDWTPSARSDVAFAAPISASAIAAPAPLDTLTPLDTLSYTALSELERCGYRYYLERVLGLAERRSTASSNEPRSGEIQDGLDARMRGTIIHRLLERLDFASDRVPSERDVAILAREEGVRVSPREREEIAALLSKALGAELARRLAAAARGVRREYPFTFSLGQDEPLVTGVIDLFVRESDGGVLVVDYKSDRVGAEDDLEVMVEREYAIQRLVYALAALSDGGPRVEVVHWFLHRPGEPIAASYTAADKPELEDRVAELTRRARTRAFTVSREPHRALCLTCPGRSGLCSWGDADTLRERVGA